MSLESPRFNPEQEKFNDFSATMEQITTRGDGTLEKADEFNKADIDFGAALDHLNIHHGGEVAGSQFNGEIFQNSEDVRSLLEKILPDTLNYDQFGRAELTLDVKHEGEQPLGYTGVKSIEELQTLFPDAVVEQKARIAGGAEGEEDGVRGSWYPEMEKDPATGRFVVAKNPDGSVKNPNGKFESLANIATVSSDKFREVSKTDKVTVIIQKGRDTAKPTVLTIFPGENAPAFPAKINSESYKASTLGDTKETNFWNEHVFIRPEQK